jgi:hypothetical protein
VQDLTHRKYLIMKLFFPFLTVSKTPNTERQKEQEKILQELTQLTDELSE